MPLPLGGDTPWPPTEWRQSYIRYGEHSAWYSGSAQELTRFYAGYAGQDRTGFFDPSTTAQPYVSVWRRYMFWARQTPGAIYRIRLHVPLAADISATSSDTLFSDPPEYIIPEAHQKRAPAGAKEAQKALDEQIDEGGINTKLLEAAEVASALGGVFLRIDWDKKFCDEPIFSAVHPDSAVPEFTYGKLTAVTFWRVALDDGKNVYRQLERHEPGFIFHGLYKGSSSKLGKPVPLSETPATSSLQAVYALDPTRTQPSELVAVAETGLKNLTVVYVPNMRPNRADRMSALGRSDYAGVEGLLDSLDETYTSWMRDIRLGRARLIVPEEYLAPAKRGQGAAFDLDREVYETLKMHPQEGQITPSQFAIRTNEHSATADALVERIVSSAGFSGSTFGLKNVATVERTATEVKAREHRTLATRGRKIEYWSPALSDILEVLLEVNHVHFGGPAVFRPRLEFPESVQESSIDLANAVQLLAQAQAISLETKIEMVHPDWDPAEVQAEVARIQTEQSALVPYVRTGAPQPVGGPTAAPPGKNAPKAPDLGPMPPGTGDNVIKPPVTQPAP